MLKHKHPRTRGKIALTHYFQQLKPGDHVAVVRELSENFSYSKRLQGRTGRVLAKQGRAYKVEIRDLEKPKSYFIHPIHLKKIEVAA